jgi:hypothetical protein
MRALTAWPTTEPASCPDPDWDYLVEHGFDRTALELRFPLGVDWHTLRRCQHPGCERPATKAPWLCFRCFEAWQDTESLPWGARCVARDRSGAAGATPLR